MEPLRTSKRPQQKGYYFWYLLLISLSAFTFFRPSFLEPLYLSLPNLNNYIFLAFFFPAVPIIGRGIFRKNKYLFTTPVRLIGASIVISMIMANYFWQQSYLDSVYGALLPVCGYLFYFYLMEKAVNIKVVERVIMIIGFAFVVLYLFCFSIYPVKLLEYKETNDRSFIRLFLYGDGFLFLFYFLSINKFVITRSYVWLFLAAGAILCALLNQTRVYIVAIAAITVWYFIRAKNIYLRISAVAVIVIAFLIVPQLDYIKGLQNKTQNDLGSSDEYVRIKSAKFFVNHFQPSIATRVLGNGFPNGKNSNYTREILNLGKERGFFVQDIGLAGLYTDLGILAVLAFVMIYYRALKVRMEPNYEYLKMYIAFLICTSFTTDSTFSGSYVFTIAFTLYLIENAQVGAQRTYVSYAT